MSTRNPADASSNEWEDVGLVCPITHDTIVDPVQDPEGHIFEREAITKWVTEHGNSPLTRRPLRIEDLIPAGENSASVEIVMFPTGEPALGSIEATGPRTQQSALIRICTPHQTHKIPVHICCIIDVSGSMDELADVKGANGKTESTGLSVLDVVKHSVRTIITSLGPDDLVSIVSYHSSAKVECEPTQCTDSGKQRLIERTDALRTQGCTNLWDGLKHGLDLAAQTARRGLRQSVFLLTDGMPNVEPPRGHIPTLEKYLSKLSLNGQLPAAVNTFGFGYSLDSKLLCDIAALGGGSYSFIPDGGLVGTVFVHAVAAARCTFGQNATLELTALDGARIANSADLSSALPYVSDSENTCSEMRLGSLMHSAGAGAAARAILVTLDTSNVRGSETKILRATLRFNASSGPGLVYGATTFSPGPKAIEEALFAVARFEVVAFIRSVLAERLSPAKGRDPTGRLGELVDRLALLSNQVKRPPHFEALLKDVEGQVFEAVSNEANMTRWGVHYLPSLATAHALQLCNNFKDPGVQYYAEDGLFSDERDAAEAAFLALPPPKPSRRPQAAPITNMGGLFMSRCNPCFAPHCQVTLASGHALPVALLAKGDVVRTGSGGVAKVRCLLKTLRPTSDMVTLPGGLCISGYHPVYWEGAWAFPCELECASPAGPCESIFSVVLEEGHNSLVVQGVRCVSLGHSLTSDPVVAHPYFGSQAVVRDLEKMPGWAEGVVVVTDGALLRDPSSQLVCGFNLDRVVAVGSPLARASALEAQSFLARAAY